MSRRVRWAAWIGAASALCVATVTMLALRGRLDKAHVSLVYLLVVLGASAGAGRAVGLTVAGAAFVAFNFLFLSPYGTLAVANPVDWLVLLAFLATSAVVAQLLHRAQRAERAEGQRRVDALRAALLTAVSHDLRTPLTTIKGLAHEIADALTHEVPDGAPRDQANAIVREADRLDALVGDLLDLSRIEADAIRPDVAVNTLDELLEIALARAAGALGGRDVHVDLGGDTLLAGRFDLAQTVRVVVNLLDNAAKYAPADTTIDVAAHRTGDRLTLEIRDRGPGVPESERERIFEPFYRPHGTPADARGTGLGLTIARGLAEAQGGSVRYAPRIGGGSIFALDLPAADVPAASSPRDPST